MLEAFGNAATVMNHNSSRFGKFIDLRLTRQGSIGGGECAERCVHAYVTLRCVWIVQRRVLFLVHACS